MSLPSSPAKPGLPEAFFSLQGVPARGVNLGGWLVTESWMTNYLYRNAPQNESDFIADEGEWMLAYANRSEAKEILRQHYATWITEDDFRQMKALGLNAVRLVIPYWALEDGPPVIFPPPNGTSATATATVTATATALSARADDGSGTGSGTGSGSGVGGDIGGGNDLGSADGSVSGSGSGSNLGIDINIGSGGESESANGSSSGSGSGSDSGAEGFGAAGMSLSSKSNTASSTKNDSNSTTTSSSTPTSTASPSASPTPTIVTVQEPFFFKGQRKYIRNALRWSKKYGLQVVLDLHTAPGSQNGFDNSGTAGAINWDNNPSYYNRTLRCLATMVDWYVNNPDPEYSGVVRAIAVLNEPRVGKTARTIPISYMKRFYVDAYKLIRERVSAGKGAKVMPTIMFSDGLIGAERWLSWYSAMFRDGTFKRGTVILDQHLYQAFQPVVQLSKAEHIPYTCGLQSMLAKTQQVVPVVVGEMANAINTACGYYPTCWNRTMTDDINRYNTVSGNLYWRKLWEAQQLAFEGNAGGWFMWSWKTYGASQWSYRDAVVQGWIPRNLNERVFLPNATEAAQGIPHPSASASVQFDQCYFDTDEHLFDDDIGKREHDLERELDDSHDEPAGDDAESGPDIEYEVHIKHGAQHVFAQACIEHDAQGHIDQHKKDVDDHEEGNQHAEGDDVVDQEEDDDEQQEDDYDAEGDGEDDFDAETNGKDDFDAEKAPIFAQAWQMANAVAENVFGTIATILWSLQLLPQIVKSHRKRTTAGLSAWLLVLWIAASVPQGVYFIVQNINIPLIVQPQLFCALAIVTLAQCWYFAHGLSRTRCILASLLLGLVAGALELGFYYMCKRLSSEGARAAATEAMGLLGAIGLTAGLIPQYVEIWKLREVRGISFLFLAVDTSGGIFAIISLAFKETFDYIGALNYIGIEKMLKTAVRIAGRPRFQQ
ncbi:hypothetical protein OC844_002312 [Tilletia horrida]|nr:hypothetical protein OC844_002312 [Tilletia horrida]